jgi:hypothetical protein
MLHSITHGNHTLLQMLFFRIKNSCYTAHELNIKISGLIDADSDSNFYRLYFVAKKQ